MYKSNGKVITRKGNFIMDNNKVGKIIYTKRKALKFTQQDIANKVNVSFQAVSKWEKGIAYPDIELLPVLAQTLQTTVDALLGYDSLKFTNYEDWYRSEDYYWGLTPNKLCFEIMKLKPPVKPYRVLDIGCGEGKDSVFLARNGYQVTAFDIAESGLVKARELAKKSGVYVNFIKANLLDYQLENNYDIIFSSGVFHYIPEKMRKEYIDHLKNYTNEHGICVINVFVEKPFIEVKAGTIQSESIHKGWIAGELFTYYHDWLFHKNEETIFDCNSGGVPHQHCMDSLIAEKMK